MSEIFLLTYIAVIFGLVFTGRHLLTLKIRFIRTYEAQIQEQIRHPYLKVCEYILIALWTTLVVVSLFAPVLVGASLDIEWVRRLGVIVLPIGGLLNLLAKYHLWENWTNAVEGPTVRMGPITQTGLYRYTRNPMYLGTMLSTLGLVLILQNIMAVALWGTSLWYMYRNALREERLLLQEKPDYAAYCKRVPRFVPGIFIICPPNTS